MSDKISGAANVPAEGRPGRRADAYALPAPQKRREYSATQVIALGFLTAIAIGTLLLMLPAAREGDGHATFIEALFTSCTSVCVTGLTVVDTFSYWSPFGQLIILLLIQCGGLGIVALTSLVMLLTGKRLTLRDRLLIESAFNLSNLKGLVRFLKRVVKGTLLVEGAGALCYSLVFVPKYGGKGIWMSVFLGISAFCNAGLDLNGVDSLAPYAGNLWINVVTMTLIILGGIGFIVWWDILHVAKYTYKGQIPRNQALRRLKLHTKLSLAVTGILLAGGALLVLLMEYDNPATLGGMTFPQKLLASMFQSTTMRTAGFFTIPQEGLRQPTAFVCMLLMFVGGSSVGTAGGVKTTSVTLMALSAVATAKGKNNVTAFRRTIPQATIKRAMAVVMICFAAVAIMSVLICLASEGDFLDAAFETVSAICTVGVTRNYTRTLGALGKLMVVLCMYLGRIGPISLAIAINFRQNNRNLAKFAEEDVTVG